MANEFIIRKGYKSLANSEVTGSLKILGDVTATTFTGDGTGLTGVTAEWDGSHTGNASITGNLTIGGNVTVDNPLNYLFNLASNALITPGYTHAVATPFSSPWHDTLAFQRNYTVSQETSTDNSSWTSATTTAGLFVQKDKTAHTVIASGVRSVRWTFTGVAYNVARFIHIASGYSNPTPSCTVTVEYSSDNTNWTTIHTSTGVAFSASNRYYSVEPYIGNGGRNYCRITIDKGNTDTKIVRLTGVKMLTQRLGDQGKGREDELPFLWDDNKKITLEGGATTNSNSTIISSRKFTARDSNGTGLYADDASSGLSIADNGNATFTGTISGNGKFIIANNGTATWGAANDYGQLSWDTGYALVRGQSGKGIKLQTNSSSTALTLDTSQNATFAGTVGLSSNKGVNWPGGSIRAEGNTLKLTATTLIDLQDDTQIQGGLDIKQISDSDGLQIFGYDDRAAYSGNLYIDSAGNFQIRQTHGAGSGYMQIHAENYLELGASSLIYTQANFRIYDAGQLSLGSSGDYKIKYNATPDELIIHTDDNKGITIDNAGNVTFTEDVVVAGTLTAQEFHTEFVSASVIYESGSTKFGDTSDDNHNFTGSLNLDGDLTLAGTHKITIGPNTTWSKSLIIGDNANNSTADAASIGTTNGNLHLDAAIGGFATYLNFYDGTAGTAFGNGAGAVVAWMGPDGDLWKGSSDNNGSKYWHAGNDGPTSGLAAQTAATATRVTINSDFSGTYPMLVEVESSGDIYNNPSVTYNGTSDTLTSPNFSGNLTGNATTVTNGVYTTGAQTITGLKSFAGAIRITETGTAQHILIGNQDSAGVDKPAMIRGVNGELKLGYGNSWAGEGGTMTIGLTLDTSSDATFAGNIVMAANATVDGVDISGLPTTFAPTNAEQNVQSDWNATSGDALILNKPTIPSGNSILDWTADQGSSNIHANNIVGYINSTEPNEPFNPFAGQKFHDGVLTNALAGRHDRFVVTIDGTTEAGASLKLSNQNFEEYNQNRLFGTSAGETKVFNINVQSLATGSPSSTGITYSAGFFDINFYSTPFPASWSARVKNKDGNWTTVSSLTKIGNSKLRGVIPIGNWLTDIEFTLTARTSAPFVTGNITYGISEFEIYFSRMAASQGGNISSIGGYLGGVVTTASGTTSTNWNTAYAHSQATHAPTNAEANVQSDWNATSGDALILNKPTIPTDFVSAANGGTFAGDITIGGSTGSTGNALSVNRGSDGAQALRIQNSGEVVTAANYLYAASSGTSLYVQNTAVFRGSIVNDGGDVTIADNLTVNGNITIGGNKYTLTVNAPTTLVTSIVNDTINVTFTASTTTNIDNYLVFSSVAGGDYGLISVIPPADFGTTMSIIDDSFNAGGTQAYRVYAVKNGVYSSALTGTKSFTVGTVEPTNLSVVNLNTAFYIQYDAPSAKGRFVTAYNIYKHEHATQASLDRSSATLIYSGMNNSYMYQISGNNNDNFHQFWVETTVV